MGHTWPWHYEPKGNFTVKYEFSDCQSGKEMLSLILNQDTDTKILVAALLWRRWDARNKANANEGVRKTEDVMFQIRQYASDLK